MQIQVQREIQIQAPLKSQNGNCHKELHQQADGSKRVGTLRKHRRICSDSGRVMDVRCENGCMNFMYKAMPAKFMVYSLTVRALPPEHAIDHRSNNFRGALMIMNPAHCTVIIHLLSSGSSVPALSLKL